MAETEMVERFWALVDQRGEDECWRWLGRLQDNGSGLLYGYFGRRTRANRMAWELANGRSVPKGKVVRHRCDNPQCVNPAHLEIGTQKENVADRYERGRANHVRGSQHGNSKLTEQQVIEIRRRLANGEAQRSVAKSFGISQFGVRWAARGGWRHVS